MDATKIRLSEDEASLVKRADWILTKNVIIKKVQHLLEGVLDLQQEMIHPFLSQLPKEIFIPSPKISKGENYRGLPYLVLDHPRYFKKENTFAIRTLFWWGNFFSTTLHLEGDYKLRYEENIRKAFASLQEKDFFINTNTDPWEHHFEADNYTALKNIDAPGFDSLTRNSSFIKLSNKISLDQWDTAEKDLSEIFRQLILILGA